MARGRSLLIVSVLLHHCVAFMVASHPNPGLRRFRFPERCVPTLQSTDEEIPDDGDDERWRGGYFELALELGTPNDLRLSEAESCLWAHPSFEQDGARSFGVAAIPDIGTTCCKVITMHALPTNTVPECEYTDWLVLCIPMGGLGRVVDVGAYPFQDGSDHVSWTTALQNWFVAIAESIFEAVPFEIGLIGFDIAGDVCAAIPTTERWMGYLWPEKGTLCWYPPTEAEAPCSFD